MLSVRTLTLSAFVLAALTPSGWSRQGTAPRVTTQSVPPAATKGSVQDGSYKNPSIGLEFTPAKGLLLKEPAMDGTPGTTPFGMSVQAETPPLSFPYGLTVFMADALAYYP